MLTHGPDSVTTKIEAALASFRAEIDVLVGVAVDVGVAVIERHVRGRARDAGLGLGDSQRTAATAGHPCRAPPVRAAAGRLAGPSCRHCRRCSHRALTALHRRPNRPSCRRLAARGVALAVLLEQLHAHGLVLRRGPEAAILRHVELLLVAAPAKHRGVAFLQLVEAMPPIIHVAGDRERAVAAHEADEGLGAGLNLSVLSLLGVEHHAGEAIVLRRFDLLAGLVGHEVAAHLLHQLGVVDLIDAAACAASRIAANG